MVLWITFLWCFLGCLLIVAQARRGIHPIDLIFRVLLLPTVLLLSFKALAIVSVFETTTYDCRLLKLDIGLFGFSPSAKAMWLFHQAPAFAAICIAVYGSFTFGMSIAIAVSNWIAAKQLAVATVIGYLTYFFVPARGPALVDMHSAPLNAFPSLHTAWALLIWMNAPPRWRPAALVYACLTMLACLGLGEHYAVDLVAAVPLVLIVHHWSEIRRLVTTR